MKMNKFCNIKLVVSDLDGTLLNSNKTISQANLDTVKNLRRANILFTFATGRPHQMTKAYADELRIDIPIICSNGAILHDWSKNQTISKILLERDTGLSIIEFCMDTSADFVVYTPYCVWFPEWTSRISVFERYNQIAKKQNSDIMSFNYLKQNFLQILNEGVLKILVIEHSGKDIRQIEEFASSFNDIILSYPEENAIEISSNKAGKGNGIISLCSILNICLNEVCVFGDWKNDISMFESVKYSIAMQNAHKDLKKYAAKITADNDHDGFSYAVEKFILGD